ncbi:MAG: dihydrolipoyl dehydrogenase [Candidatus Eisenbacteria bacterium]|nr:dihydrolipoyl dehydrogenase [Candidatus Eisenbacteria bacterium]
MAERFDLGVIGGGPGGYVAAIRAAQLGLRVALVEREQLGGVCLNRGCIPTKALLASAGLFSALGRAEEFGVRVEGVTADVPAMFRRKDEVVARLRGGVETLLRKRKVAIFEGLGSIREPGVIGVEASDGTVAVECERVILATGSTRLLPEAFPCDGRVVVTTREALESSHMPEGVLIIGAGAVGCEFAGFYSSLGLSVTLVEMLPGILPGEDPSAVRQLLAGMKRQGVDVRTATKVESIEISGDTAVTTLSDGASIETGRVLLAMGRRPAADGAGIPEAGIEVERGAVVVNDRMETSNPGVYAIGDLVGGWLLAHVASREGVVAAGNAAGRDLTMDYRAVPRCTFTRPEIASVGITEAAASSQGLELSSGRFPFAASGKALAGGEAQGFVKILCDAASGRVVGGVIVGPHASDLIHEIALAVEAELSFEKLAGMIHAHPTLAESVMEAAEAVEGMSIHSG